MKKVTVRWIPFGFGYFTQKLKDKKIHQVLILFWKFRIIDNQ